MITNLDETVLAHSQELAWLLLQGIDQDTDGSHGDGDVMDHAPDLAANAG
jgi:hypothetical protein